MNIKLIIGLLLIAVAIVLSGCINNAPAQEQDDGWQFVKDVPRNPGIYKFDDENNTCYYAKDGQYWTGSLSCVKN